MAHAGTFDIARRDKLCVFVDNAEWKNVMQFRFYAVNNKTSDRPVSSTGRCYDTGRAQPTPSALGNIRDRVENCHLALYLYRCITIVFTLLRVPVQKYALLSNIVVMIKIQ